MCCGRHPPCYVGSCVKCHVRGVRRLARTVVPGAVSFLDRDDPMRKAYKREFAKDEHCSELAARPRPAKRRCTEVAAAAGRVANGRSTRKEEAFSDIPVLVELLDLDITKRTIYDLAHTFANAIKLLFSCISNNAGGSKGKFTKTVRLEEKKRGRFPYLFKRKKNEKKQRPKWKPKRGECKAVDTTLKDLCRVPEGWPSLRKPFAEVFFMKTSELLLFGGSAGAWVIQQLDGLNDDFKKNAIYLLRLLEIGMRKTSTPGDRKQLRVGLPKAVAALEIDLPSYFSTMVSMTH
jgi:hypothetical protein